MYTNERFHKSGGAGGGGGGGGGMEGGGCGDGGAKGDGGESGGSLGGGLGGDGGGSGGLIGGGDGGGHGGGNGGGGGGGATTMGIDVYTAETGIAEVTLIFPSWADISDVDWELNTLACASTLCAVEAGVVPEPEPLPLSGMTMMAVTCVLAAEIRIVSRQVGS